MNSSCPICLGLFEGPDIAAIPCGHVFHCKCICRWIANSKVCPECRSETSKNDVLKLFFNSSDSETLPSYAFLQNDLDRKNADLTVKQAQISEFSARIKQLELEVVESEHLCRALLENICENDYELNIQLKKVKTFEIKTESFVKENSFLRNELKSSFCNKEHTNLKMHKLDQENRKLKTELLKLRAEKKIKVRRSFNTKPSATDFIKQWKEYTRRQISIEEDRKRLAKYSMHFRPEIDMIVDSPAPDYTAFQREAERVASEAIKAIKESLK